MTGNRSVEHYAPLSRAYVESAVHREGSDLDLIEALAREQSCRDVLDLGCGGGHVTYRLAATGARVTACDITPSMLEAVAEETKKRGFTAVATCLAPAEALPFQDGAFDGVFSRFSTHHWTDALAGLREARRVLSADGIAMFVDVTASPLAMVDSWLQTLELLRDHSHVRDYTRAEWVNMVSLAGFDLVAVSTHCLRMDFASWVTRSNTSDRAIGAIRMMQDEAPSGVRKMLSIESDGSFMLDVSSFTLRPA